MFRQSIRISLWVASLSPLFLALGQTDSKQASPTAGFGSLLPMMLVMFAVVYFLMIRPEQKKQKQRQAMLQAVKKGDRVLTTAGILGTVGTVKDTTIMVKIAENTVVEFTKSAVTTVVNKDGSEKQAEATAEENK
ncbi:MAG: preprotein translocase subunit YajC [Chitinispirillaceae bacterium]|nr:preprotein translocase subunit YajC [Chitinispirillaceae bacterium]